MKGNLAVEFIKNLKEIQASKQPDIERLKAYDLTVELYTDNYINNGRDTPQRSIEKELGKLYNCTVTYRRGRFTRRVMGTEVTIQLDINVLPINLATKIVLFLLTTEGRK